MQGENQNAFILTKKLAIFKEKLLIWKRRGNYINFDMFPLTAKSKILL